MVSGPMWSTQRKYHMHKYRQVWNSATWWSEIRFRSNEIYIGFFDMIETLSLTIHKLITKSVLATELLQMQFKRWNKFGSHGTLLAKVVFFKADQLDFHTSVFLYGNRGYMIRVMETSVLYLYSNPPEWFTDGFLLRVNEQFLWVKTSYVTAYSSSSDQEVVGSIPTGGNFFLLNLFCSSPCNPLLARLPTLYNLGKPLM